MATMDPSIEAPRQISLRTIAMVTAAILAVAIGGYLVFTFAASFVGDDGPAQPDSLQLVVGGIPTELSSAVPIRGTVSATFEFMRIGGRFERSLDIYLVDSQSGAAVDGEFTMHAIVSMRFMDHDYFATEAVASGAGHYALPLEFSMPGEWQIDLVFTTPSGPASLALFAEIWS